MATDQETAVQRHDRMMREERDQAERLRTDRGAPADMWKGHAAGFAVPETEPQVVRVLAGLVDADSGVIDVGAGGGRITIPLARRVREVVAVEPSAAMREVLAREIAERGIQNIHIVSATWADAEVQPAELVFAAHVTYSIPDIEPFLRKLDSNATRAAAMVSFNDPAQHVLAPFWKEVYSEERLRLPCRNELLDVLHELGVEPRVIPADIQDIHAFGTAEETFQHLRRRLFIGEGTPYEERLREAIPRLTEERDGELWPVEVQANQQSVIWWTPGRMRSA